MFTSYVPMAQAVVPLTAPREAQTEVGLLAHYRAGGRPLRIVAIGTTVLVHLALGAVVMLGWPGARSRTANPHLASVIILPRSEETPRRQPDPGMPAATPRPETAALKSSPPPAIVLAPPAPVAIETAVEIPMPSDGGHVDVLALATQAYRRAVMARLEAQSAHIREDNRGTGAVLFRIERSGRLLDVSMTQPTGSRSLDRTALSIVRRAAPFPAIPDGLPDELAITLPVEFLLSPGPAAR